MGIRGQHMGTRGAHTGSPAALWGSPTPAWARFGFAAACPGAKREVCVWCGEIEAEAFRRHVIQ